MKLHTLCLIVISHVIFASGAIAGDIHIHNTDCKYEVLKTDSVRVHIYDPFGTEGCTDIWATVPVDNTNDYSTVATGTHDGESVQCLYRHEAVGTYFGPVDVTGDEDANVDCSRDWLGVCQCAKK